MSAFDTVSLICPSCGNTTSEQSKAGPCDDNKYSLNDAPLVVIADLNEKGKDGLISCSHCKEKFEILVRFVANVSKIGRRQEEQRNLNENSN
jgi:transcription elongation factor Elf1